jgi:hypothetical protein
MKILCHRIELKKKTNDIILPEIIETGDNAALVIPSGRNNN